jgi:hypothetical protein
MDQPHVVSTGTGMVVAATDRPIGYWLKHLHNLIDAQFDATLSDLGLSRRHWQVLNLLSTAARTPDQLEQELAPFGTDQAPPVGSVLGGPDGLVTRGWAGYEADGQTVNLTESGRAAHGRAAARVGETRRRLMDGLTPEQYAETVRVLSVMAGNIEAALADRAAGHGHPADR